MRLPRRFAPRNDRIVMRCASCVLRLIHKEKKIRRWQAKMLSMSWLNYLYVIQYTLYFFYYYYRGQYYMRLPRRFAPRNDRIVMRCASCVLRLIHKEKKIRRWQAKMLSMSWLNYLYVIQYTLYFFYYYYRGQYYMRLPRRFAPRND